MYVRHPTEKKDFSLGFIRIFAELFTILCKSIAIRLLLFIIVPLEFLSLMVVVLIEPVVQVVVH